MTYFDPPQKEVVTDVKMSEPLARASPPDKFTCKMGIKIKPSTSKKASPPSRASRFHINTASVLCLLSPLFMAVCMPM